MAARRQSWRAASPPFPLPRPPTPRAPAAPSPPPASRGHRERKPQCGCSPTPTACSRRQLYPRGTDVRRTLDAVRHPSCSAPAATRCRPDCSSLGCPWP
eukprot:scaffold124195_cov27-Tisochrysis_lutea.AAC.2